MNKVYVEKERSLDSRLQKVIAKRTPDYIVEVGSFDGEVLRQFGLASPYSKTIGFEANPKNFFRYCAGKNIQNMAVSDRKGQISFFHSKIPGRSKSGSILKKQEESDEELQEFSIVSTTLDDFFKIEIERKRTFILIIDAEGTSWQVLRGARQFLKNTIALKIEAESKEHWQGQMLYDSLGDFLENFNLVGINASANKVSDFQKNYYYITKNSPGAMHDFITI